MNSLRTLMSLKSRRALITGAAGGLGAAMADSLAELGADLLLVDLERAPTAALAADLAKRHGVSATPLACDLEDAAAREALAETVLAGGGLSILVNNAAFVGTSGLTGWAAARESQNVER